MVEGGVGLRDVRFSSAFVVLRNVSLPAYSGSDVSLKTGKLRSSDFVKCKIKWGMEYKIEKKRAMQQMTAAAGATIR